jgi:hypothetical protein
MSLAKLSALLLALLISVAQAAIMAINVAAIVKQC